MDTVQRNFTKVSLVYNALQQNGNVSETGILRVHDMK